MGPVAQRQSRGLIIPWSLVRIQPGPVWNLRKHKDLRKQRRVRNSRNKKSLSKSCFPKPTLTPTWRRWSRPGRSCRPIPSGRFYCCWNASETRGGLGQRRGESATRIVPVACRQAASGPTGPGRAPDLSERAIGEHCGVHHDRVSRVRRQLAESATSPLPQTRTGKDGKEYPVLPSPRATDDATKFADWVAYYLT